MNRLIHRVIARWSAAVVIAISVAGSLASIPVGSNAVPGDAVKHYQAWRDAEKSLQQKLRVGQERYDKRQAYRRQLIGGMHEVLAQRQATVDVSAPAPAERPGRMQGAEHSLLLEILAAFGVGVLAYCYHRVKED